MVYHSITVRIYQVFNGCLHSFFHKLSRMFLNISECHVSSPNIQECHVVDLPLTSYRSQVAPDLPTRHFELLFLHTVIKLTTFLSIFTGSCYTLQLISKLKLATKTNKSRASLLNRHHSVFISCNVRSENTNGRLLG